MADTSIKFESLKQALNSTSTNLNRHYKMLRSICCSKISTKSSEAKVQEPHQVPCLCSHIHHVHVCMYACMEGVGERNKRNILISTIINYGAAFAVGINKKTHCHQCYVCRAYIVYINIMYSPAMPKIVTDLQHGGRCHGQSNHTSLSMKMVFSTNDSRIWSGDVLPT